MILEGLTLFQQKEIIDHPLSSTSMIGKDTSITCTVLSMNQPTSSKNLGVEHALVPVMKSLPQEMNPNH